MSGWRIVGVRCGGPHPAQLPAEPLPLLLVFPADTEGEALAGAIAAQAGAAVVGRITALRSDGDDLVVTRSSHGGCLALELRLGPCLAVATANDPVWLNATIDLGAQDPLDLERTALTERGVQLEEARIVIGGGRGLDPDGFAALERIAAVLGGAVAASLPAVDLGLAPVSRQVGQSGKFVNPAVYLAAGISGTPQHFAGVGARARIVAINQDRDAPILRFAETGAIADARELLPLLADALEALGGAGHD